MARRKTVSSAKGNLGKPSGSNFQAWVDIAYGDFPSADEVEIYTVENIYVTDGDEGSWARVSYETEHHGREQRLAVEPGSRDERSGG